jgi:hypothetical protein
MRGIPRAWTGALLLAAALYGCRTEAGGPIRQIGEMKHGPLKEVSGITRSAWPGVYWVHNDSGDTGRIFAITLDGEPVIPLS